jgi:branched-chain amino acid transport system permease protein
MLIVDQIINGLAIGNVYALIAIGFTLIFGVANLINFSQGSVYMVGAYTGWLLSVFLHWPFLAVLPVVIVVTGLLGMVIERFALRPLAGAPAIAPLLSTIAVSVVIDRAVELGFSPETQPFPSTIPYEIIPLGTISITTLDLIVAAIGITCAVSIALFLRFHRLGWAIRATAQDRTAALQMGVNVDRVNSLTFGIGSALGGVAGVLVGQYYASVYPSMGFQAGLKGFTAAMIGGLGSLPGAIVGGLVLGVAEALGSSWLGLDYRNLITFALLLLVLTVRPSGLLGRPATVQGSTAGASFFAVGRPLPIPRWLIAGLALVALLLPVVLPLLPVALPIPYILQVLALSFIFGILALSLNVVSGFAGQISLGHAALFGIGAYAVALLMLRLGLTFWLAMPLAAVISVAIGVTLAAPALRLTGHFVAIATLGLGEIVYLIMQNWLDVTRGPMGLRDIPGVTILGYELQAPRDYYWLALAALALVSALAVGVNRSHLGRTLRAIREDEIGAAAQGVRPSHYKNLAFGIGAFMASLAGGLYATQLTFISPDSFLTLVSILILTMVVLGGMGNIAGSVAAAILLMTLPELLRDLSIAGRSLADFRLLFYGILLLLLIRFRPQGLFGSV